MKRLLVVLMCCFFVFQTTAKDEEKFISKFKEVKLHLANHKEDKAIPILEDLLKDDQGNSNIMYLLGYCYVKQEVNIKRAIELLEGASASYSNEYDPSSLKEKKASEYVYYYLIIAYSLDGKCEKAQESLDQFYKIYSYYDEWYLIEGQKWVRDCDPEKIVTTTMDLNDAIDEANIEELVEKADTKEEINTPANENSDESIVNSKNIEKQGTKEQKTQQAMADAEVVTERLTPVQTSEETAEEEVNPPRYMMPIGESKNANVVTKRVELSTTNTLYGVQVAAYLEPRFANTFENLKNVDVYMDNNGVYRYVIGRFSYKQQSEKLLEYVKAVGYESAFIVAVNSGDHYASEVVSVDNKNIKRELKGKVDFRVQIGAFKDEIPAHIARQYLMVDDIKETKVRDYTLLTIGSFSSYEEASMYRNKIQLIGVSDAFVVAFNYNEKIPLDEAEDYLRRMEAEYEEEVMNN